MSLPVAIAVLLVSLFALVQGATFFTQGAETVGLRLGLSPYVIGVVIVATGTSLPELVSSAVGASRGASEIAVGNVLGSNVTNICLILGLAAVFARDLRLPRDGNMAAITLLLGSALMIALMLQNRVFGLPETIICLAGLAVFLIHNLEHKPPGWGVVPIHRPGDELEEVGERPLLPPTLRPVTWAKLLVGAAAVYVGADFAVRSVTDIALTLGVGKDVVAASVVALGTSVPEIVVSLVALRQGNPEMSVGNVMGSNVFNSFAVLGISALFGPLTVSDTALTIGVPFMLAASLLGAFSMVGGRLERWEGAILLLLYALFVASLFTTP